jgi:hypothetical protein
MSINQSVNQSINQSVKRYAATRIFPVGNYSDKITLDEIGLKELIELVAFLLRIKEVLASILDTG